MRRLVFSNDGEGFGKLLEQAEVLRVRHGLKKVVYGMEPTGNYHKPLGEYLIHMGRSVVLVSGVTAKHNRESLDGRWDKHDDKDSANMDSEYGRSEAQGLAIVRWCFPISQMTEIDVDPFIERVTSRRVSMERRRRLEALWEKAGESIGCDEVPGVEHEAKVMVEGLRQIREMIKETEERIEELCKEFPEYPFLLTIPGFGPDVSAKVLGAIGDPDRFQNGKQVLKQAGLDLSANRSGKNSAQAIPQISKQGKADLRYALYQAAFIASTKNQDFMRYYTSKLRGREKEKGIHRKILVKLSAKMLLIAWTLMKKKEAFHPAYLKTE
jgi:transposase